MSILYEVNAEFANASIADAWAKWVLDEHIADVVAAGASSGRLVRIDGDDDVPRWSAQYEFTSRATLDAYLRDHAPRLREEGTRRFPSEKVRYQRRVGEILESPLG